MDFLVCSIFRVTSSNASAFLLACSAISSGVSNILARSVPNNLSEKIAIPFITPVITFINFSNALVTGPFNNPTIASAPRRTLRSACSCALRAAFAGSVVPSLSAFSLTSRSFSMIALISSGFLPRNFASFCNASKL